MASASAPESVYFPSLDRCLAGDERLISWKTAYRTLCDADEAQSNAALEAFLTDAPSKQVLAQALTPFSKPDGKSKGEFETKTAPINVSQSASGVFDLQEIKKDTQWLSEKVAVEELAALRIVILEWQSRAEDQLLIGPESQGKTLDSSIDLYGSVNGRADERSALLGASTVDLGSEAVRRERQLEAYLEEKNYVLKVSALLLGRDAVSNATPRSGLSWVDELARDIGKASWPSKDNTAAETYAERCTSAIESRLRGLDNKSERPQIFQNDASKQLIYATATFEDVTTIMRLLLVNLAIQESVMTARAVQPWYALMARYGFLQDISPSPALRDPSLLQCMVSVISLALLQLPQNLVRMQETARPILEGSLHPVLPDDTWLSDDDCTKAVHMTLCTAALGLNPVASPAIYAWGLIASLVGDLARLQQDIREHRRPDDGSSDNESPARRRSSMRDSRTESSLFESRYSLLQDFELPAEVRDDPAAFLLRAAADQMNVYSVIASLSTISTSGFGSVMEMPTAYFVRSSLLDLVQQSMSAIDYGAEVLEAILAVLSPDSPGSSKLLDHRLAARFAEDLEFFGPQVIDQALARYPFELSPFLRLFTALSSASSDHDPGRPTVVRVLEALPTMTVMTHEHFHAYALDHEDENTNSMLLTKTLPLFSTRQSLSMWRSGFLGKSSITMGNGEDQRSNVFEIPARSAGHVVKESRPMVFKLDHPHSALEYLGLLLSTILPNSEIIAVQENGGIDRVTASEILILLSALLKASLTRENGIEEARLVLGRFGYALSNEQDIVSVMGDIFESELLSHLDQSTQDGSLDILIACAELFNLLIFVSPERVWSLLARSSLLGLTGGANALAAVVGATEVHTGQFRFLLACVRMFSNLLDNAITGLISRKPKVKKPSNRFDSPVASEGHTPERTISVVVNAFQVVMLDAFQSLTDWRFSSPSEKCEITTTILKTFNDLLLSTYGLDMLNPSDRKLSGILNSTSQNLLDSLAPPIGTHTSLLKLSPVLTAGIAAADDLVPAHDRLVLVDQTKAGLGFLTSILRIVRANDTSSERASCIARELQKSMPTFASLLAVDHTLKEPLFALLTELVETLGGAGENSQSLLARLSPDAARSFLSVVSQLDHPFRNTKTESSVWQFLSAILASKQQWFAMYLLTGALPKDRLKDKCKADAAPKARSLLERALDQLSNIAAVPPEQAASMLAFIASAQNSWIWATNDVRSHHAFMKNALDWLDTLQARAPNSSQELILANEHQMAAHLCDILAVNLHASLEIGDETLLKMLIPKLGFLRDHASRVDSYNRSLHKNLADNFEKRFQDCEISDFKRSAANPASLGRDYFYDLDFATKVLRHDVAWFGALSGRNQGFIDEFARANINLSLVNAQTRLLASWNVLATTLCECADKDAALRVELAKTASSCLTANVDAILDQPGMDAIARVRAEMVFVVVSRLVAIKSDVPEMKSLLSAAWDFVRTSPADYEVATSPGDVQYYRTSLQILYLAVQPHIYMEPPAPDSERQNNATDETKLDIADPKTNACAVEILGKVIATGFRALCGNLHSNVSLALPGDFALLTALLQAVLSIRGVSAVHSQMAEIVASTSVVRGALSLYSWADQLAEVMEHDPIYGEIAIMFLLELSTVRPIAEQIALDRALAQISSANLSNYFRKPDGKGPFDQPQRMFTIWSEGILPLCLNLLDAVGAPMAADISFFLNTFPAQLSRAQIALENREPSNHHPHAGAITLGLVSEAHSLCIIGMILSSDTARGAAEGIDAADVPALGFDYRKVREDAAALVRQKTSLSARITPVGEREIEWASRDVAGASDNLLQAKIVRLINELAEFSKASQA